jgi:hypothetical protein
MARLALNEQYTHEISGSHSEVHVNFSLKMEVVCSSETLVSTYKFIRSYKLKDRHGMFIVSVQNFMHLHIITPNSLLVNIKPKTKYIFHLTAILSLLSSDYLNKRWISSNTY